MKLNERLKIEALFVEDVMRLNGSEVTLNVMKKQRNSGLFYKSSLLNINVSKLLWVSGQKTFGGPEIVFPPKENFFSGLKTICHWTKQKKCLYFVQIVIDTQLKILIVSDIRFLLAFLGMNNWIWLWLVLKFLPYITLPVVTEDLRENHTKLCGRNFLYNDDLSSLLL